ncbi:type IV pilin N-terminal domain-containing protein [Halorussus halobius]|uniref:type IV pilin N-terminal domain-containing protein n=1 Tax=Halorussus halobius TaxID=1710537 RepID=UPI00109291E9|nr:type IV pilin N-terminal domain-containing protein [Halorussus halobius]
MLPPRLAADDRATSPTLGAVLLIAITVLLATSTGAQLFGLADGQTTTFATVSVEFSEENDRGTVTWMANADADALTVRIRVGQDRRTVELEHVGDEVVVDGDGVTYSNGTVGQWDSPAVSDGDRVSVTVVAVSDDERAVVAERTGTM